MNHISILSRELKGGLKDSTGLIVGSTCSVLVSSKETEERKKDRGVV